MSVIAKPQLWRHEEARELVDLRRLLLLLLWRTLIHVPVGVLRHVLDK